MTKTVSKDGLLLHCHVGDMCKHIARNVESLAAHDIVKFCKSQRYTINRNGNDKKLAFFTNLANIYGNVWMTRGKIISTVLSCIKYCSFTQS